MLDVSAKEQKNTSYFDAANGNEATVHAEGLLPPSETSQGNCFCLLQNTGNSWRL